MLICHCSAVSDRTIRAVAGECPDDALEAVATRCGAGARCGGCLPAVQAVLDELDVSRPLVRGSAA